MYYIKFSHDAPNHEILNSDLLKNWDIKDAEIIINCRLDVFEGDENIITLKIKCIGDLRSGDGYDFENKCINIYGDCDDKEKNIIKDTLKLRDISTSIDIDSFIKVNEESIFDEIIDYCKN